MSIMIMSRLFRMNLGGCNRKLLAVRLADFADDDGRGIYPSVKRMASETELSERTVQRILADFVQEGILVVVRGATGRPGVANAYNFDLERLYSYNPAQTGDTVSPVEGGETGDNPAETGDNSDIDGCHGDTRTVIEPPLEPSSLPASAQERVADRGERGKNSVRKDQKKTERDFTLWYGKWEVGDVAYARNTWNSLTEEERVECLRRTPDVLKQGPVKSERMAAASFLKARGWMDVPELAPEAERTTLHNAFSKAWSARRFAELLRDAAAPPTPTAFQQAELRKGGEAAEAIIRERRLRYGWPRVITMHQRAEQAEGVTVPPCLVKISEGFVQHHRDSDMTERWRLLHERNGWPWLPEKMDWLFFPAGEPEEAMIEFRDAVAKERSNDDAA